ncbi:MAG: response regulator [Flavobacteriaceae bacterium]|nr:response regulator [Flavobacteriaceae bacterium]
MQRKLNCILLVDDDDATNFINKMIISKAKCTKKIHVCLNGQEALDFLKKKNDNHYPKPDIIFLDINMPVLDGWEFLEEYKDLDVLQKDEIIIIMLTASLNPDDKAKANTINEVSGYISKPLNNLRIDEILKKHF